MNPSKMFKSKESSETFQKHFPEIAANEQLLEAIPCAIYRKVLLQGKLFVTPYHLCFYSKVVKKVEVSIALVDIIELNKKNQMGMIPTAIEVVTANKSFWFASFVAREEAYDIIKGLWDSAIGRNNEAEEEEELTDVAAQNRFRKHFGAEVGENEVLKQWYRCALQRKKILLVQGILFIAKNHLCFYGNLNKLQKPTKRVIPFTSISAIEKANTAQVIPNAIEISTKDKKIYFRSFWNRDQTFREIIELWNKSKSPDPYPKSSTIPTPPPPPQPVKLSKEEQRQKMIEEFMNTFNVQPDEKMIAYFKCETNAKDGKMFVSDCGVYFHSSRDGTSSFKLEFNWNDIKAVETDSHFGMPAISVKAKSGEYTFIDFKDRDIALATLEEQKEISKKRPKQTKKSSKSTPPDKFNIIEQPSSEVVLLEAENESTPSSPRNHSSPPTKKGCSCIIV